jgi:hypothetical protein
MQENACFVTRARLQPGRPCSKEVWVLTPAGFIRLLKSAAAKAERLSTFFGPTEAVPLLQSKSKR